MNNSTYDIGEIYFGDFIFSLMDIEYDNTNYKHREFIVSFSKSLTATSELKRSELQAIVFKYLESDCMLITIFLETCCKVKTPKEGTTNGAFEKLTSYSFILVHTIVMKILKKMSLKDMTDLFNSFTFDEITNIKEYDTILKTYTNESMFPICSLKKSLRGLFCTYYNELLKELQGETVIISSNEIVNKFDESKEFEFKNVYEIHELKCFSKYINKYMSQEFYNKYQSYLNYSLKIITDYMKALERNEEIHYMSFINSLNATFTKDDILDILDFSENFPTRFNLLKLIELISKVTFLSHRTALIPLAEEMNEFIIKKNIEVDRMSVFDLLEFYPFNDVKSFFYKFNKEIVEFSSILESKNKEINEKIINYKNTKDLIIKIDLK